MANIVYSSIKDSVSIAIDTSSILVKKFNDSLQDKYSGDEFNYDVAEGEAQNILLRIIRWFFDGLESIFGVHVDPEIYNIVEKLIYFILISVALYFIVRLLTGKQATAFFSKKSKEVATVQYEEEHIEQIDLDKRIKDALHQNNFRLAIRYMYLKTLKELSKNKLIEWNFEKTNQDYYKEIKQENVKEHFKSASYLYEYIWYGEFAINQPEFSNAKRIFDTLMRSIPSNG